MIRVNLYYFNIRNYVCTVQIQMEPISSSYYSIIEEIPQQVFAIALSYYTTSYIYKYDERIYNTFSYEKA